MKGAGLGTTASGHVERRNSEVANKSLLQAYAQMQSPKHKQQRCLALNNGAMHEPCTHGHATAQQHSTPKPQSRMPNTTAEHT